jgi:hypothetical protein
MKFSSIKNSITEQFNLTNRIIFAIMGAPGCGKTAVAKEVGEDFRFPDGGKFDRVDLFYPSMRTEADFLGIPWANLSTNITTWNPPEEIWNLTTGRNLVIVDEFSDAPTPVQNVMCSWFLEKRLGKAIMSPETYFICTGNRTEDKSGAQRIQSKLGGRVRFLNFDVDSNDFANWWLETGYGTETLQFLRFRENLLMDFDPNRRSNPTPRTWEKVALIPTTLPQNEFFENVAGEVGEGAAAEYTAFLRVYKDIPSVDDIMMKPATTRVPDDPATRYALMGALAHKASKDNFDRLTEYVMRLPPEFQVMCVADAMKLKPEIKMTKAFIKFSVANANLMM